MFAKKALIGGKDGSEGRRKVINSHGRFVCELARISATCKYYAHVAAQEALKKSILGIEEVLYVSPLYPPFLVPLFPASSSNLRTP